jgi:hypothetical protein
MLSTVSTFCLRMARDKWAGSGSANKGIKVYIGALAGANYIKSAQKNYPSFGGVALWDASEAVGLYSRLYRHFVRLADVKRCTVNGHYDVAAKSALT